MGVFDAFEFIDSSTCVFYCCAVECGVELGVMGSWAGHVGTLVEWLAVQCRVEEKTSKGTSKVEKPGAKKGSAQYVG